MKNRGKQKGKIKTRKEIRKEKRLQKKKNRFNYHNIKKSKKTLEGKSGKKNKDIDDEIEDFSEDEEILSSADEMSEETSQQPSNDIEEDQMQKFLKKEKKEHDKYFSEIKKNRIDQLQQANEEEDKVIAKYEKLLKLNRRKKGGQVSSSIGKFNDGLDYLLELCTDDNIQKMYQAANEAYSDNPKKRKLKAGSESEDDDEEEIKSKSEKLKKVEEKYFGDDEDFFMRNQSGSDDDDSCEGNDSLEEGGSDDEEFSEAEEGSDDQNLEESELEESENEQSDNKEFNESENDASDNENEESEKVWEDIYGRQRNKKGEVIQPSTKYVPPHMRKSANADEDEARKEKLLNLKRQIKGYINRLAESNLHRISIDIENVYNSNARNDTNSILSEVLISSLVSNVLAKERLVLEHALLIAVLHANVGSEVGAFILQILVEKFEALYQDIDSIDVENKELDNIIFFICHLFTFKLFKHDMIYEMLAKLSAKLTEKRIECILLVLRSIGFILRKENPLQLKEFIINIQKVSQECQLGEQNSRVTYLMDTLTSIKNNNMSKIPQYDATLVEHFRKLLRQFIRDGNYVTTLAITMEDLLKAEERGKWWLVGSAWAGTDNSTKKDEKTVSNDEQKEKIFALAKKQRMNTDAKRNVFYLLMTAEDYVDAFEKIISSTNDERTIAAVILHCCLSEKSFNAFYGVLAQKFCEHNRKFILAFQFSLWDRIKDIEAQSNRQISNLSQLLVHLISNGSLPLSVLKVIQFSEIEKSTLRFMRQVMIGLLMLDEEKFKTVFERITPSMKLNAFKDQLRLFLKVFLLKDTKAKMNEEQMNSLNDRVKLAEKYLS